MNLSLSVADEEKQTQKTQLATFFVLQTRFYLHDNILDGVASVFLGNFAQDGDLGLEVVHSSEKILMYSIEKSIASPSSFGFGIL